MSQRYSVETYTGCNITSQIRFKETSQRHFTEMFPRLKNVPDVKGSEMSLGHLPEMSQGHFKGTLQIYRKETSQRHFTEMFPRLKNVPDVKGSEMSLGHLPEMSQGHFIEIVLPTGLRYKLPIC